MPASRSPAPRGHSCCLLSRLWPEVPLVSGHLMAVGRCRTQGVSAERWWGGGRCSSRIRLWGMAWGDVCTVPHADGREPSKRSAHFGLSCVLWFSSPCPRSWHVPPSQHREVPQLCSCSGRLGSPGPTCAGLLPPPLWSSAPPSLPCLRAPWPSCPSCVGVAGEGISPPSQAAELRPELVPCRARAAGCVVQQPAVLQDSALVSRTVRASHCC